MVEKTIQTLVKITRIGTSSGVIIDKKIMDLLDLKVGDYLQISIEKLRKEDFKKSLNIKKED